MSGPVRVAVVEPKIIGSREHRHARAEHAHIDWLKPARQSAHIVAVNVGRVRMVRMEAAGGIAFSLRSDGASRHIQ
jgi:hypothetical protein